MNEFLCNITTSMKEIPTKRIIGSFAFQWLISFVVLILTRLPYLLGRHCYFDGDEAIVGIMAQDLLAGKNIPVFFYGQQYGFSFFEVIGVALGIVFFGNTVWALKFGALLVFSLGISFLFRWMLIKKVSFFWALLLLVIISVFPGWMIWAEKARGGYVTAFSIACSIFYIIQLKKSTWVWVLMVGILLAVGIHAQILMMVSVGFLVLYWIFQSKKTFLHLSLLIFSLVVFYLLIKIPATGNANYWTAPFSLAFKYQNLASFLSKLPHAAMSYYHYELKFPIRNESIFFGIGYYLLGLVIITVACNKISKKERIPIFLILLGGIISVLLVMFLSIDSYRYYLGFFTSLMLMLTLGWFHLIRSKTWRIVAVIGMIPISVGVANTSSMIPDSWLNPAKNDMKMYNELLDELQRKQIHHVFCTDPLLQWMLNYSGVNARYTFLNERINRYVENVNQCYYETDCKIAVLGYQGYFGFINVGDDDFYEEVIIVNDRFFIYENPKQQHLAGGKFEMNN
jgi:hypothetical protein